MTPDEQAARALLAQYAARDPKTGPEADEARDAANRAAWAAWRDQREGTGNYDPDGFGLWTANEWANARRRAGDCPIKASGLYARAILDALSPKR